MVKILREVDAAPVAEVAKKHGVSEATIYAWRATERPPCPRTVGALRDRRGDGP